MNKVIFPNAQTNKGSQIKHWWVADSSKDNNIYDSPRVVNKDVAPNPKKNQDGQIKHWWVADSSIDNNIYQPITNNGDSTNGQDDLTQKFDDLFSNSSSSIPDLLAAFETNNKQAMNQSQTLSDNIYNREKDIYGLGEDLYYDQKNFNPLKADWAKQLLSYYGIESGEAADNARATGAADNAGNVDSYAAANAERQRLAKLNAGVNSISGMSQNRFNNMLSTLQSIGVNTANLFGVEQQNTKAALENAGKTGELAVSANETQTAADLQNNQILSNLYAAIYGDETTEGDGSGYDYTKNPPREADVKAAINALVESGMYDINDIEGIVKQMLTYPEYSNWEGWIRSIHKRMVPSEENQPKTE